MLIFVTTVSWSGTVMIQSIIVDTIMRRHWTRYSTHCWRCVERTVLMSVHRDTIGLAATAWLQSFRRLGRVLDGDHRSAAECDDDGSQQQIGDLRCRLTSDEAMSCQSQWMWTEMYRSRLLHSPTHSHSHAQQDKKLSYRLETGHQQCI